MKRVLFIGAHVDDIELCCGATIARLLDNDVYIKVVSLSHVYEPLDLKSEWQQSIHKMKVHVSDCKDFNVRKFSQQRQSILDLLFEIGDGYDTIFTHSINDFHKDHKTVGEEALRAYKNKNLVTFIGEWNQKTQSSNFFVPVGVKHINKKLTYLECYKSQQDRPYFDKEFIMGSLRVNGLKCGNQYAEAFNIVNYCY